MSIAVYPGSFDPMTNGHLNIIERMHKHYSELIVLVAHSNSKNSLFTAEERVALIEENVKAFGNVKVETYSGLTVDFVKERKAQVILRGIRAVSDFEAEMAMANMNKNLDSNIETVLVFSSPEHGFVSSRLVKEVHRFNGDLAKLVPPNIIKAMQAKG